jgi:uncharacterized protein YdcH (DUF465 family)
MDPLYKNCFLHIKNINNENIPYMIKEYNQYSDDFKKIIPTHEELNYARSITCAAVTAFQNDYSGQRYSNANISKYIDQLRDYDKVLDRYSKNLNEKLMTNKSWFIACEKKIVAKNNNLLHELKTGKTHADELLAKIKSLEKEIMNIATNELSIKKKEIVAILNRCINDVCDPSKRIFQKINSIDSLTLKRKKVAEWTYFPAEIFARKSAYKYDEDYSHKNKNKNI